MKPIVLFYHVYLPNGTQYIYDEQMEVLKTSGLLDVCDKMFVNYWSDNSDLHPIDKKQFYKKNTIRFISEIDTVRALYEYCLDHDCNVLYFHTKGASKVIPNGNAPVEAWRRYMEYFNIIHWRNAVDKLEMFDTYGTEFKLDPLPHYSGNFWWATSDYIKTLEPPIEGSRFLQEFWIGKGDADIYNEHASRKNLYHDIYTLDI